MPFYDFHCDACGNRFDKMLSIESRDNEQKCPQCGGAAARSAISTFSASPSNAGAACPEAVSGACAGG